MKLWKHILCAAVAILLLAGTTACQSVPYTGRSRMLMTSESYEAESGREAWAELKKTEKISTDSRANTVVARVGKRIAEAADCKNFDWEFLVFQNQEANAFCLPGGKVGVYTGILKYMNCEAELAGVIGHEVGHAIARHGGERMTQSILQSVGASVLSESNQNEQIRQAYGIITNLGVILPYSRQHEHEADTLGLILMAKAGYDPSALIDFWRNFSNANKNSGTLSVLEKFLSTHPLDSDRINAMQKQLPEAMKYYNNAKNKYGKGAALSLK